MLSVSLHPQCVRWSWTLTRRSLTASTLWTTNWWCTTKQIIPTVGGHRVTSTPHLLLLLLDNFHHTGTTSGPETAGLRDKWLALHPVVSFYVLLQVVSCLANRFLPLPLCRNIEFWQFYQQVAWACVWVNVWAANPCSVCTCCWFQTVYVGSRSSGKHWFTRVVWQPEEKETASYVCPTTMRQREKCYPK